MSDVEVFQEASFPASAVGKVMKNYVSLLQKRLGKKVHGPRVPFSIPLTRGMEGSKFLITGGKGIRFNWKNNTIDSVSIWIKPGWKPDFTIDMNGKSSIQILNAMEAALKGGTSVKQESVFERNFEDMYIEARQTTSPSFEKFVNSADYRDSFGNSKPSIGQFNTLYKTWARKNKEPNATYGQSRDYVKSLEGGSKGGGAASIARGDRGIRPVEEISKEAKDLLASIGLAPGEKQSGDSIFRQIEEYTNNVIKGKKIALIVAGDPGLGKCHGGSTMITVKK